MRIKRNKFPSPWCVNIEMTFGCNLRCEMCGIRNLNIPKTHFEYLTIDAAREIAKSLAKNYPRARIEFTLRGEPLLNPNSGEIIEIFRQHLSATQLMVTTNGLSFLSKRRGGWEKQIRNLKNVNVLLIDLYEPYGERLKDIILRWGKKQNTWKVIDFFRDKFNPWQNHGPKAKFICLMDDIMRCSGKKITRKIHNHGGNSKIGRVLKYPLPKMCVLPFRRFSIQFDGSVGICCNDFGLEYCVGNVLESGTKDVWLSKSFMAARKMIRHKLRWFPPCCNCDQGAGMRPGLVPKMPWPKRVDHEVVKKTNMESPRINGAKPQWRYMGR